MIAAASVAMLMLCVVSSVWPRVFLVVVMVLGPMPLGFLFVNPSIDTPLGSITVSAFKVFCLLAGALTGLFFNRVQLVAGLRSLAWIWTFFGFCVLALVWADDFAMGLRMLLKLVMPFALALYVFCLFDRIGTRFLIRTLTITALGFVLYALAYTFAAGAANLNLPGTSRAVFSGQLLAPLAVVAAELMVRPGIVRLGLLALLFGAIVAAFTRITIAGAFGAVGVVSFLGTRSLLRWVLPAAGTAGFLALFFLVDRFRERMFLNRADTIGIDTLVEDPGAVVEAIGGSGRFAAWDMALAELYAPNPLLGSGIGAAQDLFYNIPGTAASVVHSEIVRLLCDVGLLGLGLYLAGWLHVLLGLCRPLGRVSDPEARAVVLGAVGASTGYLVYLLTDNAFDYAAQVGALVFALVGAGLHIAARARQEISDGVAAGAVPNQLERAPRPNLPTASPLRPG